MIASSVGLCRPDVGRANSQNNAAPTVPTIKLTDLATRTDWLKDLPTTIDAVRSCLAYQSGSMLMAGLKANDAYVEDDGTTVVRLFIGQGHGQRQFSCSVLNDNAVLQRTVLFDQVDQMNLHVVKLPWFSTEPPKPPIYAGLAVKRVMGDFGDVGYMIYSTKPANVASPPHH